MGKRCGDQTNDYLVGIASLAGNDVLAILGELELGDDDLRKESSINFEM